jgi:predicted transposase YdaD
LIELLDRLYTEVYRNYVEFKEADMRLQDIIMTRVEEAEARKEAEMEAKMEELAEARSEELTKERVREVARNMKKIGLSVEQIAQVSGFSVKEIEEL